MSLEMPHSLQEAFSWLGLDWPQADEDKLSAAGDAWSHYADELRTVDADATKIAAGVWDNAHGEATDAFKAWWDREPHHHLTTDAEGADTIAVLLHTFSGLTLALKGVYIAQLAILAAEIIQAVATAFLSFGATLAEIPGFAAAVRFVVKEAIEHVVDELMQ